MKEIEHLLEFIREKYKLDLNNHGFHIGILNEPYLSRIFEGRKMIESRFTKKKVKPFGSVRKEDYVILKKAGGPFVGVFQVDKVYYYRIKSQSDFLKIREEYGDLICADDEFWRLKKESKYATLIEIGNLIKFDNPYYWTKKNRQAWLTYGRQEIEKKPCIICICGEIASGKTYLGNILSKSLKCERYSVSEYLKYYSRNNNIEIKTREDLQEVGKERILTGWDVFCKEYLKFSNWNAEKLLIIDGIRHMEFISTCERLCYPTQLFVVYLDVRSEIRKERMLRRGEEWCLIDHIAEGNLQEIKKQADLIIMEEICKDDEMLETIKNNLPIK